MIIAAAAVSHPKCKQALMLRHFMRIPDPPESMGILTPPLSLSGRVVWVEVVDADYNARYDGELGEVVVPDVWRNSTRLPPTRPSIRGVPAAMIPV